MKPQLFYQIADAGGAAARKAVTSAGLLDRVQFRNIHYDEVRADLDQLSGRPGAALLPALWDGTTLHEGLDAVLAALTRLGDGVPK